MASKKVLLLTGVALLAATVIAVAVAVPVTVTRRRTASQEASTDASLLVIDTDGSGVPGSDTNARNSTVNERSSGSSSSALDLSTLLPADTPACNGVPGLCSVPVRLVTFPGTHNSMAIKNTIPMAEAQQLGFAEQLKAGARLFDIDYAGDRHGPRFGHCFSCFCSFAADPNEADPTKVFRAMSDFLTANPGEVIVLGLSNINCGEAATAREELLGLLAKSPLYDYLATEAVTGSTTLGDLVDSNQRVVMLFYDQWTTPTGYTVGSKSVPNQQLLRLYGENTKVDAAGNVAAAAAQVSQGLFTDFSTQFKQKSSPAGGDGGGKVPWRVLGLFSSACIELEACAAQANSQSYVLWLLGKLTASATSGQTALIPAFNGFQVDYIELPTDRPGVVAAARQLNTAFSWMYNLQESAAATVGLGNCVWILDDAAYAGGLICADQKTVGIASLLGPGQVPTVNSSSGGTQNRRLLQAGASSGGGRQLLVPANNKLEAVLLSGLSGKKEVLGSQQRVQLVDVDASVDAVQVTWVS